MFKETNDGPGAERQRAAKDPPIVHSCRAYQRLTHLRGKRPRFLQRYLEEVIASIEIKIYNLKRTYRRMWSTLSHSLFTPHRIATQNLVADLRWRGRFVEVRISSSEEVRTYLTYLPSYEVLMVNSLYLKQEVPILFSILSSLANLREERFTRLFQPFPSEISFHFERSRSPQAHSTLNLIH